MSRKRAAEAPLRRAVVLAVRERDRTCQAANLVLDVACGGPLDVHEPMTRARFPGMKAWLDVDKALLICREHHDWTDQHPKEAAALGLLVPSWEAS